VIRALGLRAISPVSMSSCRSMRRRIRTEARRGRSAKGMMPERVPRVAGRRRVSSSVSEVGRIADPRELSAQLEGSRFSLSPGARRDECRKGLRRTRQRVARVVVRRLAPGPPPRRHTHTHTHIHTHRHVHVVFQSFPYLSALVRPRASLMFIPIRSRKPNR